MKGDTGDAGATGVGATGPTGPEYCPISVSITVTEDVTVDINTDLVLACGDNHNITVTLPDAELKDDECNKCIIIKNTCDKGELGEDCKDKPKTMTFTYLGGTCDSDNNMQGEKSSCMDHVVGGAGFDPVRVVIQKVGGGEVYYDSVTATVNPGDQVTGSSVDRFGSETEILIYDETDTLLQSIEVHTSCSQPLRLGDVFGTMLLQGMTYKDPNDTPHSLSDLVIITTQNDQTINGTGTTTILYGGMSLQLCAIDGNWITFGQNTFDTIITSKKSDLCLEDTCIDFNQFEKGETKLNLLGVNITTNDPNNHPLMIFDTDETGTPDSDLEVSLGKALIISEDGNSNNPNDYANGGWFMFEFDCPVYVNLIQVIDFENPNSKVELYDSDNVLQKTVLIPDGGNAGVQDIALDSKSIQVKRLKVTHLESGAISKLCYTRCKVPKVVQELCLVNDKTSEPAKWCIKISDEGELLICCVCNNGTTRVVQSYSCGEGVLYLSVIVDVSGSIEGNEATVRNAVKDIANNLASKNVFMSILRFSGPSSFGGTGNINDATFITDTSGDTYRDLNTELSTILSEIDTGLANGVFGGFTNWEAAFKKVNTLTKVPNLTIFITDGNPTVSIGRSPESNGDNEDFFVYRAAVESNLLQDKGSRVISALIGNNINVDNVKEPIQSDGDGTNFDNSVTNYIVTSNSGNHPDGPQGPNGTDYYVTDFANLTDTLTEIADQNC